MNSSYTNELCNSCGKSDATKRCSGCMAVFYCNRECQKSNYKTHKSFCKVAQTCRSLGGSNNKRAGTFLGPDHVPPTVGTSGRVAFLSSGAIQCTCLEDKFHRHYKQVSLERVQHELPQVIMQVWHMKKVRYWQQPDQSDVEWYLEIQNVAPFFASNISGAQGNPLVLYREPWIGDKILREDAQQRQIHSQRLVKVLLAVMLEGGNVTAQRSSIMDQSQSKQLKQTYPQWFFPRRPGCIMFSEGTEVLYEPISKRLKSTKLNIMMYVMERVAQSGTTIAIEKGFETPGNTYYEESVGLYIRHLSKEERQEQYQQNKDRYDDFIEDIYPPLYEITGPAWKAEYGDECNSLEEAMTRKREEEDILEDEVSDEDLREELMETDCWKGWAKTLEEACLQHYGAKTVEEAKYDYVGIPRLEVVPNINNNSDEVIEEATCKEWGDTFEKSGQWRYVGYKPGKDFNFCEATIKWKHRLVMVGGHVFSER